MTVISDYYTTWADPYDDRDEDDRDEEVDPTDEIRELFEDTYERMVAS